MPPKFGIIAALEREIAPLARKLARRKDGPAGLAIFENREVCLVCGGIGAKQATSAARWLIASCKPEVLMSVGFAGALVPALSVGDVIAPGKVIDGITGEQFPVGPGDRVLVSSEGVVSEDAKKSLEAKFRAHAVDMEAAAVARVAQTTGVPFAAVKAISDELGFIMLPMDRFVEAGKFRLWRFLSYVAIRPGTWPAVARLGANARKASSQLCGWLENQISRDFQDVRAGIRAKVSS